MSNETFDINQPFVTQEQKFKYWQESKQHIRELEAHINKLSNALAEIKLDTTDMDSFRVADEALASTPQQSL